MGIATAQLVGNLTSDPRTNPNGTICNLRVAVNDRRKVGETYEDVAYYFDVVVLGGQIKPCLEYLKKGSGVAVAGDLQQRDWTDKEGNSRQSTEVLARQVQFIGGRDAKPADAETPSREDETGGW